MRLLPLALAATLIGCGATPAPAPAPADFTILQLNDVYEANPVGGAGGLARVATLRERLAAKGPVLTVLAGDFLSPSAIGLAKVDGERLAGAQMIAAFDAMGLDVVTFGNHEFDVKEEQLLARLKESKATWVSSNVSRANGEPFPGVKRHVIRELGPVKLGIFSVTLNSNPKDWVKYDPDYRAVARREIAALKAEGAQVILALTHLDLADDISLAAEISEIDLVLGGHEHENWRIDRGPDFTPVRKADANARTVFVHRVTARAGQAGVDSELVHIGDDLPFEPKTAAVV
ncbi:MAG: metallophosphoesterase, partial [Myxococcales bacterium]|nr:metallophosphoesterase [Myxococcales bacterium]